MKIRVNPHNVEIIREQTEPINEKEIKVSKCEFEFDDKITNNFVKEAYFTLNGETYKQIIQNNECEYPSEVLDKKGTLEIGVVAYKVENEQEIQRYNPSPDYFESWVGSLKDAQNTEPITPTDKEQMEQALQNGLNDIDDKIDEVDEKLDGIDTAIEETNNLNLDVSNKVDGDVTVTLTKKDASTKTVVLSDGTSLEFNWDGTKLGIKTSDEEEYTYVDLQGIQGIPGPQGEPFRIKKTYSSVAEMNADFNNMEYGDYVMIASSVEVEDNAKLYTRGESQWIFITDFSGATGIRGPVGATPSIQIGTVVSGATPSVTRTGTDENPVLNFVLQKGDKGDKGNIGDTGNGISSIKKTGTSGLVDTYTITFTNGNTTTFDVSNGNGIDRIEKTATVGNKDTYTIYFTNGSTTTYEVANGEVTREELEEEVDRLSMIYNAFPTTSNEGEEITLDGTAEVPFKKLNLKGNTSQFSTTGKNLLPNEATTKTKNGITFTKNSDGTYTVSGTATATAIFPILVEGASTNPTLQAGTYTLSGCPSGGSVSVNTYKLDISVGSYNQDLGSGVTFTLSEATQINYVRILVYNGQTINAVFKPMIESGNTKTSFEPYTGGIPAPNPDYPQDIQVVSGENDITIYKENLFNGEMELGMIDYDTGLNTQNDNRARAKGYIPLFSNTFSIIREEAFSSGQTIGLRFYDSNFNYIGRDAINNFTNYATKSVDNSLDTTKSVAYMRIILMTTTDMSKKFCVVNGESTTFDSTIPQTYPVNLDNIELCRIGDYQDYIYKNNGKWYKHKEVEKGTIDDFGNINTVTSTLANNLYGFAITIAPIKTSYNSLGSVISNVLSPKVLGSTSDTTNPNNVRFNQGISKQINNTQIIITVDKSYLSTGATTELRPFLQSVGFYFYYILNQATDELITDTTLIEQLDNLENAYSYDTQTNISQTNADKPFILDVEAILSLRSVLEI